MPLNKNFVAELELQFFKDAEFEVLEDFQLHQHAGLIVRNVLRILMMGWSNSWRQLLSFSVLHAVFVRRNPDLLREMRVAFQQGFNELYNQFKSVSPSANQLEQVELYLSNCLCFLPFADLTAFESFFIPQWINNQWEYIEYIVKPIELTNNNERPRDRVFAYGLSPLSHQTAQSHLIFMGTTYPAGQGFFTQISTDIKGFETVGKSLYLSGRQRIHSWLREQQTVHVCGTSLGGSLSLLLAIDKGDYNVTRVDALNPAGLHDGKYKSRYDHWSELEIKPRVIVQKQANDPVSWFGLWKADWEVVQVIPPANKKGPNLFCDHALNYAGFAGTEFKFIDVEEDNNTRKRRNFWFYTWIRAVIYYLALIPYIYVIRPLIYFFVHNPLFVINGLTLMTLILLSAFLPKAVILFSIIALIPLIGLALFQSYQYIVQAKNDYVAMHDPLLPRNKNMDIYDSDNKIATDLTYKEIHSYYKLMSIVKKQKFLPDAEHHSKYFGTCKKELLEYSMDETNHHKTTTVTFSKAKFAFFRKILKLIPSGDHSLSSEFIKTVEDHYHEYRKGKTNSK